LRGAADRRPRLARRPLGMALAAWLTLGQDRDSWRVDCGRGFRECKKNNLEAVLRRIESPLCSPGVYAWVEQPP
jgi:hypothetical protein